MAATGTSERSSIHSLRALRGHTPGIDWDALVRQAFFEGCLQEGIRAAMSERSLAELHDAATDPSRREALLDSSRRAALAWLTIETCLEQYGELAALALERCLEEAALQARRQSTAPSSSNRAAARFAAREDAVIAIVARGRERLVRFWASGGTSAA